MAQSTRYFKKLFIALTGENWKGKRIFKVGNEKIPLTVTLFGTSSKTGKKIAVRYLHRGYYNDDKDKMIDGEEVKRLKYEAGIKFIDFPFYCAFSEEVVRYYFLDDFFGKDENHLQKAIKRKEYKDALDLCYKIHRRIPGWYTSIHRIHTFTSIGINRFEQELKDFKRCSRKIYDQVIHSIAVDYLKSNDRWIDLMKGFEFNKDCDACQKFIKELNKIKK